MYEKIERHEVRFCGSGGQGIITAALVLAEAAGIYDGKYVSQTQSYGPEARGGTCKAEVVISTKAIEYPKARRPSLLLAMNQASCDTYFQDLRPDGLLIVDSTFVKKIPTGRVVSIPFTQIARQKIGKDVVSNMVALGAFGQLYPAVSIKSLKSAVVARAPDGTSQMNLDALSAGLEAARYFNLEGLPSFARVEDE